MRYPTVKVKMTTCNLKRHLVSFRGITSGVFLAFSMVVCRSAERKDTHCILRKPQNGNMIDPFSIQLEPNLKEKRAIQRQREVK